MKLKVQLVGVIHADNAESIIEEIIGRKMTNKEWLKFADAIKWENIITEV